MRFFPLLLIVFISGCSSRILESARINYYNGRPQEASVILSKCDQIETRDRLLCLMEKGTIAFYMEDYHKSTGALLEASHLMDKQDQISILDQTSAIIISDQTTEYKGEFAERLWTHTYLMMNFLLQNNFESSLVEAKQALEILERYPQALELDYFSRALIALCFENMGKRDDAQIEYNKLESLMGLQQSGASTPFLTNESLEVVLFISQGKIPFKAARNIVLPPSIRISVPEYSGYRQPISLHITSAQKSAFQNITTDLGWVAQQSLQARVAEYATRQAVRAGTKEAIAQAVGQHDDLAEALVRILLFIAEEADTRSWQTLPGGLTLARIHLAPGAHTIHIEDSMGRFLTQLKVSGEGGRRLYYAIDL